MIRINRLLLLLTILHGQTLSVIGSTVTDNLDGSFRITLSSTNPDPAENLIESGYELTEDSLRKIITQNPDNVSMWHCLRYIEEQKITALAPDVKDYYHRLTQKWLASGEFLTVDSYLTACIECSLAIDPDLSPTEIQHYLVTIRYGIYYWVSQNRYPPWVNYPLVKAHQFRQVDIKNDLLYLCKLKYDWQQIPLNSLFQFYAAELTEQEIAELVLIWKDHPIVYNEIKNLCEKHNVNFDPLPSHETSNAGIQKILSGNRTFEWHNAFRYILETRDQALLPDVEALFLRIGKSLDEAPPNWQDGPQINSELMQFRKFQLDFAHCMLVLQPNMEKEKRDVYLNVLRAGLFDTHPHQGTLSTNALIYFRQLHKEQNLIIKEELLKYCKIKSEYESTNITKLHILFMLYGKELTEAEKLELNAFWSDDPKVLNYLITLNQRQIE